jgi:hypothetical protein
MLCCVALCCAVLCLLCCCVLYVCMHAGTGLLLLLSWEPVFSLAAALCEPLASRALCLLRSALGLPPPPSPQGLRQLLGPALLACGQLIGWDPSPLLSRENIGEGGRAGWLFPSLQPLHFMCICVFSSCGCLTLLVCVYACVCERNSAQCPAVSGCLLRRVAALLPASLLLLLLLCARSPLRAAVQTTRSGPGKHHRQQQEQEQQERVDEGLPP